MSHRLTPASTKPSPMLSLRLPEDLQAALVGVQGDLARATPGLEPSLSDAVRVLLREALAARAVRATAPPTAAVTPARRVLQREGPPAQVVAHTAADGQLSLLSRTANDHTPPPALDTDAIRARLVASGASTRTIAATTGVSKSSVHKFISGGGVTDRALAALAGFVSQAQP